MATRCTTATTRATTAATAATLLLVCLLAAGCNDPVARRLAELQHPTGALASGNSELVARIGTIEQAGGLPLQLDGPLGPDEENMAAALADAYPDRLVFKLESEIEALLSPDATPAERRRFLVQRAGLLKETANATDLPRCRWDVGHRWGFFARMRYLDQARMASRLLLIAALTATDPEGAEIALEHLQRSLRVAHCLAEVQRVEARVLAASLRAEALTAVRSLALNGLIDRDAAEVVYGRLRDQLADWPSDAQMLIGERATVVHAYETIRSGWLDKLISADEHRRLQESGRLARLEAASAEQIDADQVVCLKVLDALIAAADSPYHQRAAEIDRAYRLVDEAPPLFAKHLLLADLREAIRIAAADRARCEANAIALASAANLRVPPFRTNPMTGDPYEVSNGEQEVEVTVDQVDDGNVRVPLLTR